MRRVRGEGLVTEVFNEAKLSTLTGDMAIGHVRYSTAGGGGTENIQPFLFHHNTGDFALAHNGNIVNADLLRNYLEKRAVSFQSTSDSESVRPPYQKRRYATTTGPVSIRSSSAQYGRRGVRVSVMTANRIYACRDKHGLRPLSIGKSGRRLCRSSETCAFRGGGVPNSCVTQSPANGYHRPARHPQQRLFDVQASS